MGRFEDTRGMLLEPLTVPTAADLAQLRELLIACVAHGASIGFLAPLAADEADAYWQKIAGDLAGRMRVLLVARDTAGGPIIGGAQLVLEGRANGRHRAEVQKVLVLPSHRRRGIAAGLMAEIEVTAQRRGVSLLFLDTSDSHAGARQFYEALQYTYVGGIPDYALNPHGIPEPNAIFYKSLKRELP